jgi:predicted DNA-binding antitoxin AbrB/MazE fold protein
MFEEVLAMAITVEAVYENGVLKPVEPLPLREHERVSITVEPARPPIWERIAALTADAPAEEIAKLPPGGAADIDQYLYGTRKHSE